MKKLILIALPLLVAACTSAPNPFPEEAQLFDLGTGALSLKHGAVDGRSEGNAEGIISHPCDNGAYDKKGQRIIPNALVVKEL